MIQLNLLPDVKQHFIRARRQQRLTRLIAFMVAGSALGLFVLLFMTVNVWQKQSISDLSQDITKFSNQLKNTPDLNRVLTVQNQLKVLPSLHAQKPVVKRLPGYLSQVTPGPVTISKLVADFEANTIEITGGADKLENVNKFVDTLKFTKYKETDDGIEKPAFTGVVLSKFGRDSKGATYTVNLTFDPVIFDSKVAAVKLIVPQNFVTTRSETERPQALFQAADPNTLTNPTEGQ